MVKVLIMAKRKCKSRNVEIMSRPITHLLTALGSVRGSRRVVRGSRRVAKRPVIDD